MPLNRKSAVIGTAILRPEQGDPRSLEEVLYDAAQTALSDAGLKIEDIDGIVVGSNDQFDGRAISVMMASGSVGGVDRDILSTPSAGEHALIMAALRVATGLYETHLVVSWSPTEASSLPEAQRLANDPYYHRKLPLDENAGSAMQAVALAGKTREMHDYAGTLATLNRAKGHAAGAAANPDRKLPWPLTADMVPPPAEGAVAMVIASEDYVAQKGLERVAWITGMGWATEANNLGDRDLTTAHALAVARDRAYADAGLSDPRSEIDVAEITNASPYQQLLVCDVLGLSPRDSWKSDLADGLFTGRGKVTVNPSGGVACFNPVFCTGLIRVAEAANQIRQKAGNHQVRNARRALAHASSGFAMMYQSVLVLSAQPDGAAQ